jgi:hypothetical protein
MPRLASAWGSAQDGESAKGWPVVSISRAVDGRYVETTYKLPIARLYQNLQLGVPEMVKAKAGVNKSEAIRGAYKMMPNAKAKEIVSYLEQKGIEVAEGLVYQVKKISKKKKPGRRPGKASQAKTMVVAPSPSSKVHLGVGASIALIKTTADRVGGWATLKEIVDALA